MLEIAQKHKDKLEKMFLNTWGVEKYWYYNSRSYFDKKVLEDTTWDRSQFVSITPQGEIIGYLGYGVDRDSRYVNWIEIINFTDNIFFGIDLMRMIRDIFEKYRYRKITFSVIIGNPIETKYDRLVSRYGGRIVGTYYKQVMLPDGKLYDEKIYEMFLDNYLKRHKKA